MSLDWLKSISAKVGIEGRNVTIVASLVFCGFGIWIFEKNYAAHWQLSLGFLCGFFLLGVAVSLVGLLAKPQASEVTQRQFLRQTGSDTFVLVSGMQSREELSEFLRVAYNIQELPPPAARVKGSAADETSYESLSPADAAKIASEDNREVSRKIDAEADRLLSTFTSPQQLPFQPIKHLAAAEPHSKTSEEDQNKPQDTPGT